MSLVSVGNIYMWLGFVAFVLVMLALDLGVFHKKAHVISLKEAAVWSGVWVSLALTFNFIIYRAFGPERGLEFTTGYLIEKALAMDNIFVIVMIFSYFAVPALYQHRVLFWGILGALAMRAGFILAGSAFVQRFHWALYVFGGILLITGIKMLLQGTESGDPANNPVTRLAKRLLPMTDRFHDDKFFVRQAGRWLCTPLFLALIAVEFTDVIFAVDSIPAIFAITQDPFIVFTSNIFAIMGLRSMYFLLAGVVHKFVYLKTGLALVLVFVATKMLVVDLYKVPLGVSLAAIALLIGGSIAASLLFPKADKPVTPSSETLASPS